MVDNTEKYSNNSAGYENIEGIGQKISNADSFETLFQVLDTIRRIKSSNEKVYTADELVDLIKSFRQMTVPLQAISRMYGLREKVAELFVQEQISKAVTLNDLLNTITTVEIFLEEPIKNSKNEPIPAEELKLLITMVVKNGYAPHTITARYGLRNKVSTLKGNES